MRKGFKKSDVELGKEYLEQWKKAMKSNQDKLSQRTKNPSPNQINTLDKYHKHLESKD